MVFSSHAIRHLQLSKKSSKFLIYIAAFLVGGLRQHNELAGNRRLPNLLGWENRKSKDWTCAVLKDLTNRCTRWAKKDIFQELELIYLEITMTITKGYKNGGAWKCKLNTVDQELVLLSMSLATFFVSAEDLSNSTSSLLDLLGENLYIFTTSFVFDTKLFEHYHIRNVQVYQEMSRRSAVFNSRQVAVWSAIYSDLDFLL